MSLTSAKAFYERMQNDTDFQDRIKALETPEAIERYVKGELAYDFTKEEMQQVVFDQNPEMSDEELEAVTGGSASTLFLIFVVWACVSAA